MTDGWSNCTDSNKVWRTWQNRLSFNIKSFEVAKNVEKPQIQAAFSWILSSVTGKGLYYGLQDVYSYKQKEFDLSQKMSIF
jgi:hypothetical protein